MQPTLSPRPELPRRAPPGCGTWGMWSPGHSLHVRGRCIFESFVGLEAVHRLRYEDKLAQALTALPMAKMYDVGEGGTATPVEAERSATGLGERYAGIVKSIEEAKFTGKGDDKKVRGAALVLGPRGARGTERARWRAGGDGSEQGRVREAGRLVCRWWRSAASTLRRSATR